MYSAWLMHVVWHFLYHTLLSVTTNFHKGVQIGRVKFVAFSCRIVQPIAILLLLEMKSEHGVMNDFTTPAAAKWKNFWVIYLLNACAYLVFSQEIKA